MRLKKCMGLNDGHLGQVLQILTGQLKVFEILACCSQLFNRNVSEVSLISSDKLKSSGADFFETPSISIIIIYNLHLDIYLHHAY